MLNEKLLEIVRTKTLIDDNRLKFIADSIEKTKHLNRWMAEIGAYKGGSAYLIASLSQQPFFVCDSFEGLPELTEQDIEDKPRHRKGDFTSSLNEVQDFLKNFNNVNILKGFFPNQDIHEEMYHKTYSFVHLDVDLYQPTLDCLNFFYPRMTKGGIIVSDDYKWVATPGVKKAFDEFFADKPEKVEDSGFYSCRILKT